MPYSKIIIEAGDVEIITGKSYRQCLRIIHKIKVKLKKKEEHFISVSEFCDYSGLPMEEVLKALNRKKNEPGREGKSPVDF